MLVAPARPLLRMVAADVPAAQALTASFGWPHRRQDWAMMLTLGDRLSSRWCAASAVAN